MGESDSLLGSPAIPSGSAESTAALRPTDNELDSASAVRLYRLLRTIRVFEERTERAHTEGRLYGPFHSSMGQEAVAVGACAFLNDTDVVTSTHRGHGHVIAKGGDVKRMCAELWGRTTGYCRGKGGSMHLADADRGIIGENGIVGASAFLGTGAALSFVLRGEEHVALIFSGDGGLGQGVLHECLNLASLWKLPAIFVIENNGYAHSFAAREGNLSNRATVHGIPGMQVDGTDVLAVAGAVSSATERARSGLGPTLIETVCYRWRGHNLGDADHLYRDREEVKQARRNDPVAKFRGLIEPLLGSDVVNGIDEDVNNEVAEAIDFAEASPTANPAHATGDTA